MKTQLLILALASILATPVALAHGDEKHDMPAHRVGRLWKFKKEQVDAWVEAGGAAEPGDKGSSK